MKKLVIFGAGPIGRMLAYVFQNEYQTVFIDVNQSVIYDINRQGEFGISILGNSKTQEVIVGNISAISSNDQPAVDAHLLDADLVLTACGMGALPFVAPTLAKALTARLLKRKSIPLFVVACENATEQNSSYLRTLLLEHADPALGKQLQGLLYTPDCMIDRVSIIPNQGELVDDKLRVKVEEYFQLCIKKEEIDFPDMPEGVSVVANLEVVKKQKLFTVNTLHALIAYYGFHFGYNYIHEALEDTRIAALVSGILYEIKIALRTYGISAAEQDTFSGLVLQRFQNKNLCDSIARVARDPIRKADKTERFVAAAVLNIQQGNAPAYIASGLGALYLYNQSQDSQAMIIGAEIKKNGFKTALEKFSGITPENSLYNLIEPPFYMGSAKALA